MNVICELEQTSRERLIYLLTSLIYNIFDPAGAELGLGILPTIPTVGAWEYGNNIVSTKLRNKVNTE